MTPTTASSAAATRGGMVARSSRQTPPTASSVRVWPKPQATPWRTVERRLRLRVARLATAARWSASRAWRSPSSRPRNSSDIVVMASCLPLSAYTSAAETSRAKSGAGAPRGFSSHPLDLHVAGDLRRLDGEQRDHDGGDDDQQPVPPIHFHGPPSCKSP